MANINHKWKRGDQREDGRFFLRKTDGREYWGDKDDLEKIISQLEDVTDLILYTKKIQQAILEQQEDL